MLQEDKRFLSLLICFAMLLALVLQLPLPAATAQDTPAVLDLPSVIASGTCGDSITWSLDNTGALNFTGSGSMWDYEWCIWAP